MDMIFRAILTLSFSVTDQSLTPPVAKKILHKTTIHGEELIDNYFWLRDRDNPEVIEFLEAENTYTEAVMEHTKELQDTLYKEMLGRIKETDVSVPVKIDDYYYYSRTEESKQYRIHCRKKSSLDDEEEIKYILEILIWQKYKSKLL